jgi:high affinity sulfate transporter 1
LAAVKRIDTGSKRKHREYLTELFAMKLRWPEPLAGLRGIKVADLPRETAAGITLAAMIIPLNIGFTQVAGLPPTAGLYAGIIPLVLFALFTSSRQVVASPDAPITALLAATLVAFAPVGDPLRLQYALAIALLSGVLFFVFWLFRLAFLANFLSRAVLAGFITGLGIEVFTNQVRRGLGVSHGEEAASGVGALATQAHEALATSIDTTGYFAEVIAMIQSIPHANWYSLAIFAGTFAIVRLMKRYTPKVPGPLVALIVMTVVVGVFGLDGKGVSVLGTIPSGLPTLTVPNVPLADYVRLFPAAMAVVAITLAEALLLVRAYDRKHGVKSDGGQVLFAYGVCNVAGAFSGSLVTGPSASRSAAMDDAGASGQFPSLVAAGTIALVMIFFTDKLAALPTAALAGIVASAVLKLVEVGELREFWHLRRSEFWVAAVCVISVLALGPLQAVVIAFLLSTIDLLRRASRPGSWVLREAPDGSHFLPEEAGSAPDTSGLIVYRFGAPLYFANANLFEEEVEKLVTQATTPVKCLVLDAEAMVDIDTSGAEVLHQVLSGLADRGVTVAISRANEPTAALLAQYHLLDLIGDEHIYPTNRHAVAAYRDEYDLPSPETGPAREGSGDE